MKKKLLSLFLIFVLVFSILPNTLALDEPEDTDVVTDPVVSTEENDTPAEPPVETETGDDDITPSEGADSEPEEEPAEEPAPAEQPSDPVIEEEPAPVEPEQPAEPEPAVQEPVPGNSQKTLVSADGNVAVSGILPDGAELSVKRIANPFIKGRKAALRKSAGTNSNSPADVSRISQWNYLAFYDLKLVDENVSVQPDGTVTVTISGFPVGDDSDLSVLHILDSVDAISNGAGIPVTDFSFVSKFPTEAAAANAATGASGTVYVEILDATRVNSDTIRFSTSSFSIYAIIDNGVEVPRAKYVFQNADGSEYLFMNEVGEMVDNQILKNGESLSDVGTPTVPDGTVFQGWYVYDTTTGKFTNTKIEFDQPMTVADGSTPDTTIFYVRPYFGEVYFLTFYDDVSGHVILSMIQVPKSDDPEHPTEFDFNTVGSATVTDPTVAFVGWTTVSGGTEPEYTSTDTIPVTSDMTFYPVFKTGHWIYFVSAPEGSGATYIAPVFVPLGASASDYGPPTDPTWKNHTFIGWYTHDNEGNEVAEFNWNTQLTADVTLYGKWRADDVKYIISIYKQNVNDDKNAADADKTYTFYRQYERTASAGTLEVFTPEEFKTMASSDPDNFRGFVFNANKSEESAELNADGSTNIKVYYDRVTVTMNFIGYPGGTDTIYTYTDVNGSETGTQYGQVNGVYKELTRGDPITRYEYSGYTGNNFTGTTLYGSNNGNDYFELSVAPSNIQVSILSTSQYGNNPSEYTGNVYDDVSSSGTSYDAHTPATKPYDTNKTYYYDYYGGQYANIPYFYFVRLYWRTTTSTVYTFTDATTGEVYWSGTITSTNRPNLYTRNTVTVRPWLYDGQPYYGARYFRSSNSETGLVYTGLYGQTLEQNGYVWPRTDGNNNPCSWEYDNDQGGLTGMSYLGEFVLPDGVADPNGQIINLHYVDATNTLQVLFYLMGTDGEYPDEPTDSGSSFPNRNFTFSEKYDGFNVTQYRRYYMDGNTKVYVDRNGNRVTNPEDAWATAVVDATTPTTQLVTTGNNSDIYWTYSAYGNNYAYGGTRYRNGNSGAQAYAYQYIDNNGYFQGRSTIRPTVTTDTSNSFTQYAAMATDGGTTVYLQLTRHTGGRTENLNIEIRYARKQWQLNFVDSLDGHSSLTDKATGEVILAQTLYYNEDLGEYEPAESVVPECSSAGYVFKGWFKDQACDTPFDWSENMPNADLNVYAGWEQEWFYVKLIPDGGTLLTSQATYFWENYGEKVVEYGTIKKNFVEDPSGPYVYYFGEFDTTFGGTGDRDYPQATHRYALYFTNDGTKVVIENEDGTKTESEYVTAYRNKVVDGHYVYDEENNIVQEPYQIPASTIYQYGVQNGFIDTTTHYKYEKDAYALVGWYDVTDGTRKVYNFAGGVNKDTVLQAVWRKVGEYHVGYSTNGVDENGDPLDPAVNVTAADVPTDPNTYADNSDTAVLGVVNANSVPEGYAFVGWYYDGEVLQKGEAFTLNAGRYADENKIIWLKPVFVPVELLPVEVTYITYDGNGGTTTVTSDPDNYITVNADGTQITDGALQINATQYLRGEDTFTRNGYTLLGWAFTPNATTPKFEFGQAVGADNLDVTGNTLYAVWQKKTYTVTIIKDVPNSSSDTTEFAFADPSFNPIISAYQGTFGLTDGGTKTFTEVPYGTTFKVTEDAYAGYETTVTYTVTDADDTTKNVTDVTSSNGATYTVDGNITVTVTNTLKLTQLKIKKTGMETGENAVFTVTGMGINGTLTVVVKNGETVTIDGVYVGEIYTITEIGGWTWKYTANATSVSKTIEAPPAENLVTFTNTLNNNHWLSGENRKTNVFKKATTTPAAG